MILGVGFIPSQGGQEQHTSAGAMIKIGGSENTDNTKIYLRDCDYEPLH